MCIRASHSTNFIEHTSRDDVDSFAQKWKFLQSFDTVLSSFLFVECTEKKESNEIDPSGYILIFLSNLFHNHSRSHISHFSPRDISHRYFRKDTMPEWNDHRRELNSITLAAIAIFTKPNHSGIVIKLHLHTSYFAVKYFICFGWTLESVSSVILGAWFHC